MTHDTDFIYYTLPQDKLVKFGELVRDDNLAVQDTNRTVSQWLTKEKQALWKFLRDQFDQEFYPYYKDGIYYEWCYYQINSNTLFVGNTALFEFDELQEAKHYIRYK